jgi:hypothetical protein
MRGSFAALERRLGRVAHGAGWWREIVLIGGLYGAYEFSRGLGDINVRAAVDNGREILHLEQMWHLAPERVLNEALAHATVVAILASYFYSLMHYVVTPAVLVWMYRRHHDKYGSARTALAISTTLGLIGYLLLPTAPPRMLDAGGLRDTLADTRSYGWWGGEGSVPRGFGALTNQFAAMPSLHVGWAIWCGALIAVYAQRRWVRLLGIAYPLVTTVVVMATGNHYLLDAIAGAITMAAGALLAAALPHRAHVAVPAAPGHDSPADIVAERSTASARAAWAATPVTTAAVAATQVRAFPPREIPFDPADPQLCRPGR